MKLLSDLPDRLAGLSEVFLFSADGKKLLGKRKILALRGAAHEIIRLEGIGDRNEAEKLKGVILAVSRGDAYELEEGSYFIPDLLGMRVEDQEKGMIGTLRDVLDSPAQDILQIRRKGLKDLLMPMTKETVLEVDFEDGIIRVRLPKDLWEVYD